MKFEPCLVILGLAVVTIAARADTLPVPRVMSDAPTDKGSWRMDMLEMPGRSAAMAQSMGGMTVCSTAAQAMARDRGPQKENCTAKLVEDTTARAVMEVQCSGPNPVSSRSTITRDGPKAYLMSTELSRAGQTQTMKMRMSYAGPCSEKDSVISYGKDSPMCRKAGASLAAMNPARCPQGPGGDSCRTQMASQRAQIEAACK
jgi:hypothetical protein